MKKMTLLLLFGFITLIAFSQNNKYSIYVSFDKKRKVKNYTINLLKNDTIYNIIPNNYFRFYYKDNNLKLVVLEKGNLIFEMDSIEKYYIYNNNTVYIDITINKEAKPNSVSGIFIHTDVIADDDFFCINCIEERNNHVIIGCSEGEFDFKKNRKRFFLRKIFD